MKDDFKSILKKLDEEYEQKKKELIEREKDNKIKELEEEIEKLKLENSQNKQILGMYRGIVSMKNAYCPIYDLRNPWDRLY